MCRSSISLIAVAVLLGAASQSFAQTSSAKPIVTKQNTFSIPFSVENPNDRPAEVHLYVSADDGRRWVLYQKQAPYADRFHFRAGKDGRYSFAVRTVAQPGQKVEIENAKPELVVTVDTSPPELKLHSESIGNGEVGIGVQAQDLHLDADSIVLEVKDSGGQWSNVTANWEAIDQTDGFWHAETAVRPRGAEPRADFRVTVRDSAGNRKSLITSAAVERPNIAAVPLPNRQPKTTQAVDRRADDRQAIASTNLPNQASTHPNLPSGASIPWRDSPQDQEDWNEDYGVDPPDNSTKRTNPMRSAPARRQPQVDAPTSPVNDDEYVAIDDDVIDPTNDADYQEITDLDPAFDQQTEYPHSSRSTDEQMTFDAANIDDEFTYASLDDEPSDSFAKADVVGADVQMTSEAKLQLDYDFDDVGPKGVARVDIWMTEDGGASWYAYGRDRDLVSPAEIDIEREGTYGFRLVVESKDGFAGRAPRDGEPADVWIGVDWTRPSATITSAKYAPNGRRGFLRITWSASDENLGARPIHLMYSSSPEGPWEPIVDALPNTGSYDWRVDRRVPRMMFVRLEVEDEAGNIASDQLEQPISSAGLAPKAKIRSVRPVARRNDSRRTR